MDLLLLKVRVKAHLIKFPFWNANAKNKFGFFQQRSKIDVVSNIFS